MNVRRSRGTAFYFLALVLAVILLEVAISSAVASGVFGFGNGLVKPFPSGLARVETRENTGEIVVSARLTKLCTNPPGQGGAGSRSVPLSNLSITFSSVPGGQLLFDLVTNSSGVAAARVQVGTYNVAVTDARVNRSATLQVVEGINLLNFTSHEQWLFASFFDVQSAGASGPPEPWANLTAAFPELSNVTVGSRVVLDSGGPPRCPIPGAPLTQPSWASAVVVSLDQRQGLTWVTYSVSGAPVSVPESLAQITYASTYGESSVA